MSGKRKKKKSAGLFDSIRKPIAPGSHKLGAEKREDKLDPVRRKAKHKQRAVHSETEADV